MTPHNGQRVTLVSLLLPGHHPGQISDARDYEIFGTVTVVLDRQETPVGGVLYFDREQDVINSSRWQACWPE